MADIAMLVAEEYERRVRISRNKVGVEKQQELGSCVGVLALKLKTKIGHPKLEVLKLGFEPKSQIGVAAFNGAFSA
ncbi:hypothetical protein Golob_007755 [Gossypium lobatum]|uniref:Uncharacterized protein n=1 Tax=Gossypium lobatum TaxID=34289 RepID=A0A7J8MDW9_9ROSI|nr:hypothetical protein [Gossypium lobatum]